VLINLKVTLLQPALRITKIELKKRKRLTDHQPPTTSASTPRHDDNVSSPQLNSTYLSVCSNCRRIIYDDSDCGAGHQTAVYMYVCMHASIAGMH